MLVDMYSVTPCMVVTSPFWRWSPHKLRCTGTYKCAWLCRRIYLRPVSATVS
jgi:hypothetical protein